MPNPFDKSDPEKLIPAPIIEDKKDGEPIVFKNLRLKGELVLHAYLMKLLELESDKIAHPGNKILLVSERVLVAAIDALAAKFKELESEDKSQELPFSRALSDNWRVLLTTQEELQKLKKPPQYFGTLSLFLKELQNYPTNAEHSIGYYLTEYTGEDWIPFPYMDQLRTLHEDSLVHKEKSVLHRWVTQLRNLKQILAGQKAKAGEQ